MIGIDLAGKSALVTGGGEGIGRACALRLAEAGAKVYVNDVRAQPAEGVAREVDGVPLVADIMDPEAVQRMVEAITELDIVVNNAGFDYSGSVATMPVEDWDRVHSVHLRGMFTVIRACCPILRDGSSIVNISSVEAIVSESGQAAYSGAKAGILGMTRGAAIDLGPKTRVNAVCPGYVQTRLTEQWLAKVEDREAALGRVVSIHPAGRIGLPEDIANAVLFLASDLSSFMTGQYLVVDGGLTARLPG